MLVQIAHINPVQDTTKHGFSVKANKDSYGFLNQVTTRNFSCHYVIWSQGQCHKPKKLTGGKSTALIMHNLSGIVNFYPTS
jgi:hypothetical protein